MAASAKADEVVRANSESAKLWCLTLIRVFRTSDFTREVINIALASHGHGRFVSHSDSMLIGVTVSSRAKQSAIDASAGNNAIAEVTDDQYTNKVRAQKYITVRGRLYVVGIECDGMANSRSK